MKQWWWGWKIVCIRDKVGGTHSCWAKDWLSMVTGRYNPWFIWWGLLRCNSIFISFELSLCRRIRCSINLEFIHRRHFGEMYCMGVVVFMNVKLRLGPGSSIAHRKFTSGVFYVVEKGANIDCIVPSEYHAATCKRIRHRKLLPHIQTFARTTNLTMKNIMSHTCIIQHYLTSIFSYSLSDAFLLERPSPKIRLSSVSSSVTS